MLLQVIVCFAWLLGVVVCYSSSSSSRQHCLLSRRALTCSWHGAASSHSLLLASSKELDISFPPPPDDENISKDARSEKEEEEAKDVLEMAMAQELFDELRGGDERLSIDKFMAWDDIQEVLDNGVIDEETMMYILEECDVRGKSMNLNEWMAVVDLINEVELTLQEEQYSDLQKEQQKQQQEEGGEEGEGGSEDTYDTNQEIDSIEFQRMLAAMGMKVNTRDDKNTKL